MALKRYACELFELSDVELAGFWRNVARVARALGSVFQPAKQNYAIYGNLEPQIHCHQVSQFYSDDPTLPLNMQAEDVTVEVREYRQTIDAMREELRREQPEADASR